MARAGRTRGAPRSTRSKPTGTPAAGPHALDLRRLRTYRLSQRKSKVDSRLFAKPVPAGGSIRQLLDSLPHLLAAADFRGVIEAIVTAHRRGRLILVGLGSHVIKVGLNPLIIDLMERGLIHGIALNGSGIIHDVELALHGQTSEEVEAGIDDGSFGMAEETAAIINQAIADGHRKGLGIGEAVGRRLTDRSAFPHQRYSLLAAAIRCHVPVTVHVAIGTDIIHMHASCDGAALGASSLRDFHRFTELVARLRQGVYLNIGSAVILPEVFLKALTIARNLGFPARDFTTVNMDFIQHYRPLTNVVRRPTQRGGRGYALTGHHELMVPLLVAGLLDALHGTR
jgi:deoxyhypusine synthase